MGLLKLFTKVENLDSNGKADFSEEINQEEAFTKIYRLKKLTNKEVSLKITDATGRTKTLYL